MVRSLWAQRLREAGCTALLLDPLGPVLAALGMDENSMADTGRFLDAFDHLLAEAGMTESLVAHHMGHGAERGRGASRLRDWPDAEWKLIREGESESPSAVRYLSALGRDVDVPESALAYDPFTRHLWIAGGSRAEVKLTAAHAAVLQALADTPGLTVRGLQTALAGKHAMHDVRDAAKALRDAGKVRTEPGPRNAILHYVA
jgi:hypothetical protein